MTVQEPIAPPVAAPAPAVPAAAPAAARPGSIILTRHGEPALSRKCLITARQYKDWWAQYEIGGLLAGQTPPAALVAAAEGAGAIYASTRQRAQETAAAVAAGREVMSDALFIEAPLPPPALPDVLKLSPRWWGVVSRIWWRLSDRHHTEETHREAKIRADLAARKLIERAEAGQDVLVLAHGYFNHMVGRRLKANGWALVHNQGFKYWSQRRYERR
ncbi:MAG: histidine phosphatase family protein [Alphaproteobacteria bacterium]|nr:histidine phosphatase family protein [Alphaproteobacteria bacterium]MBU1525589.1 histidine phosphatase family protein [Alphaproteobacteria bacterium]MBU2350255.1 histidine phosphatase family protein [Alphaproteobacteria bacterium]MBU2381375.1 histidine phosphatase family protein [Alphaproteobacteria bacterium]